MDHCKTCDGRGTTITQRKCLIDYCGETHTYTETCQECQGTEYTN